MKKDTLVYVVIERWAHDSRIAGIFLSSEDANDMLIRCREASRPNEDFEWAAIEEHYLD